MELFRLTYVSRATAPPGYAGLTRLLDVAQDRNGRDGITGQLCYAAPFFVQAVEGPPAAVNRLLTRLYRDPRHTGIEIAAAGPARRRLFAGWAMRLIAPRDLPMYLIPAWLRDCTGVAVEPDEDAVLALLRQMADYLTPAPAPPPPALHPRAHR